MRPNLMQRYDYRFFCLNHYIYLILSEAEQSQPIVWVVCTCEWLISLILHWGKLFFFPCILYIPKVTIYHMHSCMYYHTVHTNKVSRLCVRNKCSVIRGRWNKPAIHFQLLSRHTFTSSVSARASYHSVSLSQCV